MAVEVYNDNHVEAPHEKTVLKQPPNGGAMSPNSTLAGRKSTLTTSLGPGSAIHVSEPHAIEFELQEGSLEANVPAEVTITQGLAFVDCETEASSR